VKREALLILFAGIVFGTVVGFILTREHYEKKLAAAEAGPRHPTMGGTAAENREAPFDPDRHDAMIARFIQEAGQPGNLDAKVTLGNIYYDRGNFEAARGWYEQAVALDGRDANVLVDLGVCYRNLGGFEKALDLFDRALAIEDGKKQALYNKVVVLAFDLERPKEALVPVERLKALFPGDEAVSRLAAEVEGAEPRGPG